MKQFVLACRRFLTSHAGKATACVVLADALIAMPDLLGWAAASFLLYRAIGELRIAFRPLDATPAVTLREAAATAVVTGDLLDHATALDMASRDDCLPAVIHSAADMPATRPGRRRGVTALSDVACASSL
jgi:hypothetical protein